MHDIRDFGVCVPFGGFGTQAFDFIHEGSELGVGRGVFRRPSASLAKIFWRSKTFAEGRLLETM